MNSVPSNETEGCENPGLRVVKMETNQSINQHQKNVKSPVPGVVLYIQI